MREQGVLDKEEVRDTEAVGHLCDGHGRHAPDGSDRPVWRVREGHHRGGVAGGQAREGARPASAFAPA